MKKIGLILALVLGTIIVSCSTDNDSVNMNEKESSVNLKVLDCPDGYAKVLVKEFVTHQLHRASSSCFSRFSICSVYRWVEDCVPNSMYPNPATVISPTLQQPTGGASVATVIAEILPNNQLRLRFPIELLNDPEFNSSDFETFGFDSNYDINGMTVKADDYTPVYTDREIQVIVDLI